jgi:hypothetical protein
MAAKSALVSLISLIHGDKIATLSALTEAYASDYGHFARANNRDRLEDAAQVLGKSPKDKAIAQAMADGHTGGALVDGYIGARTGALSKQSAEIQAHYQGAIDKATDAFADSLEKSGAFDAPVKKTEEEKEKAKAEKAQKAQKAFDDAITAKIQAGELVRSENVRTELGQSELTDAIVALINAGMLDKENAALITQAIKAATAKTKESTAKTAKA